MQCSFDGLPVRVRNDLKAGPTSGNRCTFEIRRRTVAKILVYDGDGYWIWSKRLELDEVGQANLSAALEIKTPPKSTQSHPGDPLAPAGITPGRGGQREWVALRRNGAGQDNRRGQPGHRGDLGSGTGCAGEKVGHHLSQEPGSYTALKSVHQVILCRDMGEMLTRSAPPNVVERTTVDVSFLAGMPLTSFAITYRCIDSASA